MIQYVVVGTHEYEWCLWPFAELFAKYWGEQQVTYFGDRQVGELPDNLTFRHVPCYDQGVWPWKNWFGNGINSIMDYYKGWIVCLFLPDHWLTQEVDVGSVERLAHYMSYHDDVIRGHLTGGTGFYQYGHKREEWNGRDIWEVPKRHPHASIDAGLTFCPSLWSTQNTPQVIDPGWSLWDCEKAGTRRLEETDGLRVVGVAPPPIYRAHGLSHHHKNVNLSTLLPEDREIVRAHIPEGWGVIE